MERSIEDIDKGIFKEKRGRIGENGDKELILDIVRVNNELWKEMVIEEREGMIKELIEKCGFEMIEVWDNRDIKKLNMEINYIWVGRRENKKERKKNEEILKVFLSFRKRKRENEYYLGNKKWI